VIVDKLREMIEVPHPELYAAIHKGILVAQVIVVVPPHTLLEPA
jgi:hypothetical protein